MDPSLYNAITKGEIDKLTQIGVDLLSQKTPLLNTALHVAVEYERKEWVEAILQKWPSLLWTANVNGDTALHIAARLDLSSITELLLHYFRQQDTFVENGGLEEGSRKLVRFANKVGDTALHEAVRKGHTKLVKLLADADPECEYSSNTAGETPLFLAAMYDFNSETVAQILRTWPSAAHDGPNGMTALHAAARIGVAGTIKLLLENKSYTLAKDENGMTPLHIAVSYKKLGGLVMLREHCPDWHEVVDNKGRNFLHIAVVGGDLEIVKWIFIKFSISKVIVNQPDTDGNTPLHIAVIYRQYEIVVYLCDLPNSGVDHTAKNKQKLTAYDVLCSQNDDESDLSSKYWDARFSTVNRYLTQRPGVIWSTTSTFEMPTLEEQKHKDQKKKERKEKITQQIQKVSDSHLVVATLIATVTFAAGFALPGGYKSEGQDEGMAALLKEASFEAFAISNTLAMLFSSLAVVSHFLMKLIQDPDANTRLLVTAFLLTFAAIFAMMLAFATGTYAVLAHSPGLAISTCVIGCSFYIFCGLLLYKYIGHILFSDYF